MTITTWGQFRDFINSKNIGSVFTKQSLTEKLIHLNPSTIGGYCSLILQGKFIVRVGRGKYQLLSHLPENLTMGALFSLLRGDNLSYIEAIQNQKDSAIIKEQFLKERNEILARLIADTQNFVTYSETLDPSSFGLKQLRRNWTWELNKTPNPTKRWLSKQNEKAQV